MRVEKNDWLAGLHWYSLDKIESVGLPKLMLKAVKHSSADNSNNTK